MKPIIRRMKVDDLEQVLEVESASFAAPWTRQAFLSELANEGFTRYYVAVVHDRIVGYTGMWIILNEVHITNIAVLPEYRGHKIGEALLCRIIEDAVMAGCRGITLEVRVSNIVAQNLYRKYDFAVEGIRKGYYSDNGEDALIMWKWFTPHQQEI